ncbi:hypothetical protein FWK35_00007130 [Aphis craccivora]|nr:hypothetical protein FWK35_00007130 [Aphis craccivora]
MVELHLSSKKVFP